jgi:DNA-binding MarR family transcriptional regulator
VTSTSSPEIHAAIACLQRLSELFQHRREQLAESVGLTEQQWSVLEEISTPHFMPSLFAKKRSSSAAAVSKILRQLLDKRVVAVRLNQDDGRQRQYVLTVAGKKILEELRAERARAIETVWKSFPQQDLEAFTRFGNQLTERLERYAQSVTER